MQRFVEMVNLVSGIVPLDLQAARTGDYVSMKNHGRCAIILFKAAGTAGDDPDVTLYWATDVAGAGAAVAPIITEYWVKQGVLTAVGTFTRVTQAASETISFNATSAEEQLIAVIDIDASKLDVDGGFDCIRLDTASVGTNAQLGCVLYALYNAAYPQATLPSAIVD